MDTNDAMRAVVARSGMSLRSASVAMGKTPNYLASALGKSGSSEAATVAALGRVCGHTLALMPDADVPGTALVIDPPDADQDAL